MKISWRFSQRFPCFQMPKTNFFFQSATKFLCIKTNARRGSCGCVSSEITFYYPFSISICYNLQLVKYGLLKGNFQSYQYAVLLVVAFFIFRLNDERNRSWLSVSLEVVCCTVREVSSTSYWACDMEETWALKGYWWGKACRVPRQSYDRKADCGAGRMFKKLCHPNSYDTTSFKNRGT